MEMLAVEDFTTAHRGRRVLVTGHTGFKGSWLVLWLTELGARVTGVSLDPPSNPNHWDLLKLCIAEYRLDIRDLPIVQHVIGEVQPEIVFHLAAQPIVRRSYNDPVDTWSTNVMGTVNVLEACRLASSIKAVITSTTDKCYENSDQSSAHIETDRLGGHDPYSASKAGAELVVASYRAAFMTSLESPLLATVRAGNVIGGGDWGEDRLIPDLVRAQAMGSPLVVRSPDATRPWQHVLDCLAGYLLLGANLLAGKRDYACAWNFGSHPKDAQTVAEVLAGIGVHWPGLRWRVDPSEGPHESRLLSLDSTRARSLLGWRTVWSLDRALTETATWYRRYVSGLEVSSRDQLAQFVRDARGVMPQRVIA